ncbi:C39 family peptidase [Pleomorphomonas carboxyditropha]|uniref:Peptidase C39-like domain-containing protein n=1 Tax=Pleomorphomonas carboxyditropha TaxID=2023338 RepID=A0A2G9WS32_9HYPH|nr:C39 family peptidase [Pleomorphomonas carboxyditropha]PIO97474.1 hypothetical protein CJ014_19705 [Pleomorphomonas carboxyditropha]
MPNSRRIRVPYFSQWESAGLTSAVVAEGERALLGDPLWQRSGAASVGEYARWANNLCGMACLKMILGARGEDHPTLDLAKACAAYGGYVVNEAEASIRGLIYAPFVSFVEQRFGLRAEVKTGVATAALPSVLDEWDFFIASVNPGIRWPEREPSSKGGHLVLVTAATAETIRFNNPSGHAPATQADVELLPGVFDGFFANRGIAVSL